MLILLRLRSRIARFSLSAPDRLKVT